MKFDNEIRQYSVIRVLVRDNGELIGECTHINMTGELSMIVAHTLSQAVIKWGVYDTYEVRIEK